MPLMKFYIRPYQSDDLAEILALSVLAWEPVFTEWEKLVGPEIFPIAIYADWRKGQKEVVEKIIKEEKNNTLVTIVEDKVAGYIVYSLDKDREVGVIQLLAVGPDDQNHGIGTELNLVVLQKMREAGMKVATVGTGGDAGHTAARKCYEKSGFNRNIPGVHYYLAL
jgi:ribosomal protein S18 acetylase RimI-like enzyme